MGNTSLSRHEYILVGWKGWAAQTSLPRLDADYISYSKYPVGEICVDRCVLGTQACNRILLTLRLDAGYKYVHIYVRVTWVWK